MKNATINREYVKIFNEVPLFCLLLLRDFFAWRGRVKGGALLLVNVSLIGEFAATAPAMHDFIERQRGRPVDLLVSAPLKELAGYLRGVRHVYTAASVFRRAGEGAGVSQLENQYGEVVVTRISPSAYEALKNINPRVVRTALPHLLRYGFHLAGRWVAGRTPRSWREMNFKMLGGAQKNFTLDEMFDFPEVARAKVRALPQLALPGKRLLVHTGASWAMNRWPDDNWTELLQHLHEVEEFNFIFIGTKRDTPDREAIQKKLSFPAQSLLGELDLIELVLLMQQCDFLIGVDSGPRNMAHLAGLRSMTFLGPGPHMYTPPDPRDVVLDHSKGRGVWQRFFISKHPLIETISAQEAYQTFFEKLYYRSPVSRGELTADVAHQKDKPAEHQDGKHHV